MQNAEQNKNYTCKEKSAANLQGHMFYEIRNKSVNFSHVIFLKHQIKQTHKEFYQLSKIQQIQSCLFNVNHT